jgi:hypothetical protein
MSKITADTINYGAVLNQYRQNPSSFVENIRSGQSTVPLRNNSRRPLLSSNQLEINCENYTSELLNTFVQSCYPDNELRQRKLKYLVSFYLFKGACKSMMSREPTRKIIKRGEIFEFYGGNFKLSFSQKKPSVILSRNIFDVLVDTTPFVSYTILQKIQESTKNLIFVLENSISQIEYESVQEIILKVMCENMPGISTFNYLGKATSAMLDAPVLALMKSAYNILYIGYQIIDRISKGKELGIKSTFKGEELKEKYNHATMVYNKTKNFMVRSVRGVLPSVSTGNTSIKKILNLYGVYLNLLLFISYRQHFTDYKIISETNVQNGLMLFRNTYFSEEILHSIGGPEFTNNVNNLIELRDIISSLTYISTYVNNEFIKIKSGQSAGKKEKRKRLVDCTVKELKEKMKKKGKKLSKDGVPLTKSQMIKSLKK